MHIFDTQHGCHNHFDHFCLCRRFETTTNVEQDPSQHVTTKWFAPSTLWNRSRQRSTWTTLWFLCQEQCTWHLNPSVLSPMRGHHKTCQRFVCLQICLQQSIWMQLGWSSTGISFSVTNMKHCNQCALTRILVVSEQLSSPQQTCEKVLCHCKWTSLLSTIQMQKVLPFQSFVPNSTEFLMHDKLLKLSQRLTPFCWSSWHSQLDVSRANIAPVNICGNFVCCDASFAIDRLISAWGGLLSILTTLRVMLTNQSCCNMSTQGTQFQRSDIVQNTDDKLNDMICLKKPMQHLREKATKKNLSLSAHRPCVMGQTDTANLDNVQSSPMHGVASPCMSCVLCCIFEGLA